MELSPQLATRFETLQNRYPVKRSALIPMLLYAQDEYGFISDEIIAEMRESLKIVRQAMSKITDGGPFRTEAAGIIPPDREKMKTEMEALIYHFKIFTEGFSPPPGEAFAAIESPRGELGVFVASDGSPKPLRVHFRGPSFINLQALPKLIEGKLISDVIACIGTIDIVLGEVDR